MSFNICLHLVNGDPIDINEIEQVSLVNEGTFGKPPVFKENPEEHGPVLYINTTSPALVAFEIESS